MTTPTGEPRRYGLRGVAINDADGNPTCCCGCGCEKRRPPHWDRCGDCVSIRGPHREAAVATEPVADALFRLEMWAGMPPPNASAEQWKAWWDEGFDLRSEARAILRENTAAATEPRPSCCLSCINADESGCDHPGCLCHAATEPRPNPALDVERLARAMRVSLDIYGWPLDEMAADIAAEYARLAEPSEERTASAIRDDNAESPRE